MKHLYRVMAVFCLMTAAAAALSAASINGTYDGKQDVAAWQASARKKLAKILGVDYLLAAPTCDLAPKTLWKRKVENGTIEKVRLQIAPHYATNIYICIPDKAVAPHNVFICMQGHSTGMHVSIGVDWKDEKTPITVKGDRDFAVYCLKKGIPVICVEQRAMGENSQYNTKTKRVGACYQTNAKAILKGKTLIGYRVFDIKRVVDYIKSNPMFDSSKIGIMGNSGGGTTAMFAGAILPELTHVMPSCSFSSFKDSIHDRRHCLCNYIPNLMLYGESADVLGLIAPRPLVVINGQKDRSFPLAPAQAQFKRIKQIYTNIGAADKCVHVIGPQGHQFYADLGWGAMLPLWNSK